MSYWGNFWISVNKRYERIKSSRWKSNTFQEIAGKIDVHELQSMHSMFEDIFDEDWDKVRDAINNENKKRFFQTIVDKTGSQLMTPFRYMARGAAGLVLLVTTYRVTKISDIMTEAHIQQIYNNEKIEEIEKNIEEKLDIKEKLDIEEKLDGSRSNVVVEAVNHEIRTRGGIISNFKTEGPSILLFLLLSGLVYYIEKMNGKMGGGMKKRKKQTRKSKKKGRRKSKRKVRRPRRRTRK